MTEVVAHGARRPTAVLAVPSGLAVLAVLAGLLVLPEPSLLGGSPGPAAGRLALETTATLICVAASLAMYVRHRRTHTLRDLILVYAFSLLSLTAVVSTTTLTLPGEPIGAGPILAAALVFPAPLLFVGALRETRNHWAAQAAAAARAERRRFARDLHDGVVQELGYIRMLAAANGGQNGFTADVIAAVDRAAEEARRSIAGLTAAQRDEDLSTTVKRAAAELVVRYGLPLHVSLDRHVAVRPAQHEALERIMREAVMNAARHAEPGAIWVSLKSGELSIRDDGKGFDPGTDARSGFGGIGGFGGFGLIAMSERAASVGAVVAITSTPAGGTTVRVRW